VHAYQWSVTDLFAVYSTKLSLFICNAYKILLSKPEGKRPLSRSRRRWEDNINKDLREIGWGGMD
jgi:hypothetical protein